MTGFEFLEEAIKRSPAAKRAPLTAYSATEATMRAINEVGLDSKPGERRFTVRLPKSNRENGG